MRICLIAPAENYHTRKWCAWFLAQGYEVSVVSFTEGEIPGVSVFCIDTGAGVEDSDLSKLRYLTAWRKIRKTVEGIAPDLISVHYATSYGITVALSGIQDYSLSVWGLDIYDFPRRSVLHRAMLKYSLRKAPRLLSTSRAMADEAAKYTSKEFFVTPFGVDMELFHPGKRVCEEVPGEDGTVVFGTVKGLSDKYGIAEMLRAAALVRDEGFSIALRIAGKGPQEAEYKALSAELGIEGIVTWLGFVDQETAAKEWANMDVALVPSTEESESFGVSAVEAQACGVPVIISDIPGLMEATVPGETCKVIARKNVRELADAMEWMIRNPEARREMGIRGREFVAREFELDKCFRHIEKVLSDGFSERKSV